MSNTDATEHAGTLATDQAFVATRDLPDTTYSMNFRNPKPTITCGVCRTSTCNAVPVRMLDAVIKAQLRVALKPFVGREDVERAKTEMREVADASFQKVMSRMMAVAEDAGCPGAQVAS